MGRSVRGLILGDEIVDLSDPATGLPPSMSRLFARGPGALDRVRSAPGSEAVRHVLADMRRHAPVPDPPAVLAIAHAARENTGVALSWST